MADISKIIVQGTLYDVKDSVARNRADSALSSVQGVIAQATGSTQGNAELLDIRVGYDGANYQTAGAAVRGQVSSLAGKVSEVEARMVGTMAMTATQMDANWNNG